MTTSSSEPTGRVMCPQHPQWAEFYNRLSAVVAKDGCRHSMDVVVHLLRGEWDFAPDEIQASVSYFTDHGGYCPCEILMNVGSDQEEPTTASLGNIAPDPTGTSPASALDESQRTA